VPTVGRIVYYQGNRAQVLPRGQRTGGDRDLPRRPSVLDEFKPYLHDRFNAGNNNISALFREIP